MSKDLRDLINNAEVDDSTRSQLQEKVENLSKEIRRLNKVIYEQKILRDQLDNNAGNNADVPNDVKILKDMIVSNRQDLMQKDEEIEDLKDEIAELNDAKTLITQLMDENEKFRTNNDNSKNIIQELVNHNEEHEKEIESLRSELKNHNEEHEKEIESLRSELKDKKEIVITSLISQDLSRAHNTIEEMTGELNESKSLIQFLQQELEKVKRISSENLVGESIESEQIDYQNPLFVERPKKPSEIASITKPHKPSKGKFEEKTVNALKKEPILEKTHVLEKRIEPKFTPTSEKVITIGAAGRRECPKCGNRNKKYIKEYQDKTNIILSYPKMYGKKFRCGKCGTEWRKAPD